MTGSAEHAQLTPGRPTASLIDTSLEAIRAADGHAAGVYLRSSTPGLLRLSALVGLPGRLFRPWWRLHVDRPFPVSDAHRLGVEVVLANATETMRRYPQFAASLPFQFGSLYVPVAAGTTAYGVLTVLRPSASDATELLPERERLTRIADALARQLRDASDGPLSWDGEPLCVRPPAVRPSGRAGGFTWDPATHAVAPDDRLRSVLGAMPEEWAGSERAFAGTVAPDDTEPLLAALRDTAAGRPPPLPLYVRGADGALRLVELWASYDGTPGTPGGQVVHGIVLDPGPGSAADTAADLLPEGVFALDRLGTVVYANPRAAELLGRSRPQLLGKPLWDAVPWLAQPACEDHMRGALLSPEPVHFHVGRPSGDLAGDWLALSLHPGPDLLTCTVRPAHRVSEAPADTPAEVTETAETAAEASMAPLYRPIVLAIALTEAVTARQVSEVVMRELLPAFGGRRLAIYLLQERHLFLAWESGFPPGFLAPFDGVGLDKRLPGVETLTNGRPLFFDSMQQLMDAYPGIALDATEGARAFLPLIASGRPVGSCILGFDRPRSFSTEERAALTALAGLIAHAMEKAQRYESEATLARGLQQALLPRRLSAHPMMETAGRYLPATQGMEIGGDWYDVVAAGDGLALVIGDVQGHGVQAAATMGQLRTAVRAFALGDRPPDEVMSSTNRLLIDIDSGLFASCCYIRLDPVTGVARVARAGHLPPLLRRPDGRTHRVDLPGGVVLGVDPQAQYPVTELVIDPGAVLALYTDGLVERPGWDIDDGIGGLRVALARSGAPLGCPGGQSLAKIADRLTATARHTADRPDDIALLLATRRSEPGHET
ncbi:SpoIIE family protein phosphatase [Streptomyces cinnabarinus]|uniref:SpoIIE family protein phosphatase n=1 Tax=Streptomyces cinnabarinus TaxID=67287 RepID=A0ABY7KN73_9ACTN|nr:SpoIIE family protein phosphatase [Streptomyces cinnabarinus]WAZ26011.1 SpoIIE family protein phosphatase [Streptomyces cinnabarinus]